MRQSPAIIISLIALTFSLGGGAGYAASVATGNASATKITWHLFGLQNHWKPWSSGKHPVTGAPAYTVSNGVVYLSGACHRLNQTLPIPSVIAVLPKGARPAHQLWFTAFNEASAGGSFIEVTAAGQVIVGGSGLDENFFTSLAGIEFPLGS
jgi:hypothetical protein